MPILRWGATAALVSVTGVFLYQLVFQPLRCNAVLSRSQQRLFALAPLGQSSRVLAEARYRAATLRRCMAARSTDIDMYMTVAAFERIVQNQAEAARLYRAAMMYDRRPELFYNLGVVELEIGHKNSAEVNFLQACTFDIRLLRDIPDDDVRRKIALRLQIQPHEADRSTSQ